MSSVEITVDFSPVDGDPTQVLEVVGKDFGTAFPGGVGQFLKIDSAQLGRAAISLVRLPEASEAVADEVTLLTLVFRVVREGEASLEFVAGESNLYDGDEPLDVSFVGTSVLTEAEDTTVPGQNIHVSPSELRFSPTEVGGADSRSLRIVNRGYSDLEVQLIETDVSSLCTSVTGTEFESGVFAPLGVAPFTVPPFGFVELRVFFEPPAAGFFAGCLVIESNDSERPLIRVPMFGQGGS